MEVENGEGARRLTVLSHASATPSRKQDYPAEPGSPTKSALLAPAFRWACPRCTPGQQLLPHLCSAPGQLVPLLPVAPLPAITMQERQRRRLHSP